MLGAQEKSFFIYTAIGARELSGCDIKQGAVLIQDRKLLAYGFNKKIIKEEKWEISAIYDAIFGSRTESLIDATLFCTFFPSVDDIKLMVSVGIASLYLIGETGDAEAVYFINKLNAGGIPLEIILLNSKKD